MLSLSVQHGRRSETDVTGVTILSSGLLEVVFIEHGRRIELDVSGPTSFSSGLLECQGTWRFFY